MPTSSPPQASSSFLSLSQFERVRKVYRPAAPSLGPLSRPHSDWRAESPGQDEFRGRTGFKKALRFDLVSRPFSPFRRFVARPDPSDPLSFLSLPFLIAPFSPLLPHPSQSPPPQLPTLHPPRPASIPPTSPRPNTPQPPPPLLRLLPTTTSCITLSKSELNSPAPPQPPVQDQNQAAAARSTTERTTRRTSTLVLRRARRSRSSKEKGWKGWMAWLSEDRRRIRRTVKWRELLVSVSFLFLLPSLVRLRKDQLADSFFRFSSSFLPSLQTVI